MRKVLTAICVASAAAYAVRKIRHSKRSGSQNWFWSPEWQTGEREVNEELRRGHGAVFINPEDMFSVVNDADV